MARLQKDSPYIQSRAALREIYGTRRIDASAPQSARDMTPSGRIARAQEQGASPVEAQGQQGMDFKEAFRFKLDPEMKPRLAGQVTPRLNQPAQADPNVFDGSQFQDAFQNSPLNLIPPSPPAETLAEFLPATTSPLNNFALPKTRPYLGGLFESANKWRAPL